MEKNPREYYWTVASELVWLSKTYQAESRTYGRNWTIDKKILLFEGYIRSFDLGPSTQFTPEEIEELQIVAAKYLILLEKIRDQG